MVPDIADVVWEMLGQYRQVCTIVLATCVVLLILPRGGAALRFESWAEIRMFILHDLSS